LGCKTEIFNYNRHHQSSEAGLISPSRTNANGVLT
jgi:hypothetical protein